MGGIAKKAFLAGHEAFESFSHSVDGVAQLADFIAPIGPDAHVKMTFGDPRCGAVELSERARDAAHEREPEQSRKQHHQSSRDQPGADVKKQSATIQTVRRQDEGGKPGWLTVGTDHGGLHSNPVPGRACSTDNEARRRCRRARAHRPEILVAWPAPILRRVYWLKRWRSVPTIWRRPVMVQRA